MQPEFIGPRRNLIYGDFPGEIYFLMKQNGYQSLGLIPFGLIFSSSHLA